MQCALTRVAANDNQKYCLKQLKTSIVVSMSSLKSPKPEDINTYGTKIDSLASDLLFLLNEYRLFNYQNTLLSLDPQGAPVDFTGCSSLKFEGIATKSKGPLFWSASVCFLCFMSSHSS